MSEVPSEDPCVNGWQASPGVQFPDGLVYSTTWQYVNVDNGCSSTFSLCKTLPSRAVEGVAELPEAELATVHANT